MSENEDAVIKACLAAAAKKASVLAEAAEIEKWLVKHEGPNRKQRLAKAAKARKAKK